MSLSFSICIQIHVFNISERLSLPPNVRVMFEVHDLKYATLATVSRCGMVWFSEDVLKTEMICENFLARLQNIPLEEGENDILSGRDKVDANEVSPTVKTQRDVASTLTPYFSSDGL